MKLNAKSGPTDCVRLAWSEDARVVSRDKDTLGGGCRRSGGLEGEWSATFCQFARESYYV